MANKSLKTCSRGHQFYNSSDCPVCPKCWPGYYEKNKIDFPKLAAPALRALINAGVHKFSDLEKYTEAEVSSLHGIGNNALKSIRHEMLVRGISFKDWRVIGDLIIGSGRLAGRGVFAKRDFRKEEVVSKYNLKLITTEEYNKLPKNDRMFTHNHYGQIYLYLEPDRYVNHSRNPNTYQDLKNKQDIAVRDIQRGKEITTDATKDDI